MAQASFTQRMLPRGPHASGMEPRRQASGIGQTQNKNANPMPSSCQPHANPNRIVIPSEARNLLLLGTRYLRTENCYPLPMPPHTATKHFLSDKVEHFTESVIREMTRQAMLYGAVNLSQGFPDFPAPTEIKRAA